MQLGDLFEELAYGELSDANMAENGDIKPEQQPKVVIKLNDVLTDLYTKYVIKTVTVSLDTRIKSKQYSLASNNLVKILYVHPELLTEEQIYKNNDQFRIDGPRILFVKPPIASDFEVVYQWKPLKFGLNPGVSNFKKQELGFPSELGALVRTRIASAIFQNMNGELHKKTGVEMFNQAQFLQQDLEMSGALTTSVDYKNSQFMRNGFV